MKCIECQVEIPEARAKLGYVTCLEHGTKRMVFASAPAYNKGPYMLITQRQLKESGKK